jgi:hypothetical protein
MAYVEFQGMSRDLGSYGPLDTFVAGLFRTLVPGRLFAMQAQVGRSGSLLGEGPLRRQVSAAAFYEDRRAFSKTQAVDIQLAHACELRR